MFRFAISPSSDIDVGYLREALLNYICATQADDKLLIRMEDMKQVADTERKDQEILEMLTLFGISYTDVTYQSHNLKFHQQLATKLLMDKNAFSCFCTPSEQVPYDGSCEKLSDDEVLNNEAPFCVRIKLPGHDIEFDDIIQGTLHFSKESIDSFILLHVDKTPTHDFASALDDLLSDISMIIKAQERLPNTAKQIVIRDYLGYDKKIAYAHLPTIEDSDDFSIASLLEEGFLPQAISNYLIMMGNDTPVEIFDMAEALRWFDISKISKSPVKFEINRLREINREHIKRLPALELAKFIGYSSKDLGELAKIYTAEASTINEIKPKIDAIFAKREPSRFQEEFATLVKVAKEAPYFKAFDDFWAHLLSESALKEEALLKHLRYLLTGAENGPKLGDIYPHIKNYLGEIIQ